MPVQTSNIIFLVVVITLFFLVVSMAIVLYVRLYNQRKKKEAEEKIKMKTAFDNQLLQSRIEVQESTISALGKELHDNVGQLLSTTKMLLAITERNMPGLPDTFATAHETLAKAIVEVRALSKSLDKEWLEQFDFFENLAAEIKRINASGQLQVQLSAKGNLSWPTDKQIILFRIVQEAMQNAIKHAGASQLDIDMETGTAVQIVIRDNGKGMSFTGELTGMGMLNMKHRVQLLRGTIAWNNHTTGGTQIDIHLPLNNDNENQHRIGG